MNRMIPIFAVCVLSGCATMAPYDIGGSGTQLETRQIQTREYDTLDKPMTMRSVVATLQDLGFTIDLYDVSPDETLAVGFFAHETPDGVVSDLHLLDLPTGTLIPLTRTPAIEMRPVFDPSGTRIAYHDERTLHVARLGEAP